MSKNAVIYGRYSSSNQREESIDAQVRACRHYAEHNDVQIIDVYKDEAITGKTDNRDDFQRMISAVMKGHIKVDFILVHKFNRFARNKFDSAIYKKRLKEINVRVLSVTQNIEDTPEGAMMESFLEAMDEYYSANLAAEVRKGLRENALKAKHTGGIVPFGFDVDENGNYIRNENAAIVKRVFSEIAAGIPKSKIIEQLNSEGHRNQKGKMFNSRWVYDILRNEKYIGNFIYTIDKKETIRLDGVIANPIISRELWDKVQDISREPTKKRYGKQKRIYYLTGKTVCGECGSSICGGGSKRSRQTDIYYYYYMCAGKTKTKNGCTAPSLNKEWYEEKVLKKVLHVIFDETRIKELAKSTFAQIEIARNEPSTTTTTLKNELIEVEKKQERLMDLYVDGNINKNTLDEKNESLKRRKYELSEELQKRKTAVTASDLTEEAIFEYLTDYMQKLKSTYGSNDEDFMQAVFAVFVEKVVVYSEKIVVFINADFNRADVGANTHFGGVLRTLAHIAFEMIIPRKTNIWASNDF